MIAALKKRFAGRLRKSVKSHNLGHFMERVGAASIEELFSQSDDTCHMIVMEISM